MFYHKCPITFYIIFLPCLVFFNLYLFAYVTNFWFLFLGFMFLLCIMSLGGYGLIMVGWYPNTNLNSWSVLGGR